MAGGGVFCATTSSARYRSACAHGRASANSNPVGAHANASPASPINVDTYRTGSPTNS
jgi:hypothetical protein